MNIILDNTYSSLISITIIALVLLFIKNRLINITLKISEKTNTVYDELLLHSIKIPSSYLIVIGYLLIVFDYFIKQYLIEFTFSLSSSIFLINQPSLLTHLPSLIDYFLQYLRSLQVLVVLFFPNQW